MATGKKLLACVVLGVLGFAAAETPPLCKKKAPIEVEEKLLRDAFPKGIYLAMMKKLEPTLEGVPAKDERTWDHVVCFTTGTTDGTCHFNKTSFMSCDGLVGGIHGKAYGDLWATKTDNLTYIVYVTCVQNTRPCWLVLATKKTLDAPTEDKILRHLEALGFSRKDALPVDHPMRGTKITKKTCHEEEGT